MTFSNKETLNKQLKLINYLWSEYNKQDDSGRELTTCEVGKEAVIWVQRLGIDYPQNIECTTYCSLHYYGEAQKPTLLKLCCGIPACITQMNPKYKNQDLTCNNKQFFSVSVG